MKKQYFAQLLPELATRASRATLSRLGFSNASLRAYLERAFSASYGAKGCFVGDPVFEATFGWEEAEHSLAELSPELLTPALVSALDRPGGDARSSYRFPREARPYRHQLEAWRILGQDKPQSVVVTSGTGSGKTECFMVPILDQLARAHAQRGSKLIGVQALFLYPLNALIQSQRERLNAWTSSFGDGLRFCLYNGLTPQKQPQGLRDQMRNEVLDRESLRAAPPPLLVTNATMLEYMLVRAQDAPILEQSQGALKWIVLDEAHTYIGSQAAELALLLRRVLHAFGVTPEQVRFVATSATIGGGEAEAQLREFLARVAGLSLDRVHVVSGHRVVPDLDAGEPAYADAPLEALESIAEDPGRLYAALCANKTARSIRASFTPPNDRVLPLSSLAGSLCGHVAPEASDKAKALRWLDLLTLAQSGPKGKPTKSYLPLRSHLFHNVLNGLWACADLGCRCKAGTELDSPDWSFGLVYTEPRKHCECGSPVYELRSCNECNTTYLWARRYGPGEDGKYRLLQTTEEDFDEFSLDTERAEEDEQQAQVRPGYSPVLIANAHKGATEEILVDAATLALDPLELDGAVRLRGRDESVIDDQGTLAMVCPECGAHDPSNGLGLFRKAILGAPFLLGEIVPTLLEFCPDIDNSEAKPLERPYRGRRMISFTDSRQGTARIAARLQQDSERNRIRGLVFTKVLTSGSPGGEADVAQLQGQVEALGAVLAGGPNPQIQVIYDSLRAKLLEFSGFRPVPFAEMVQWLSSAVSDVRDWMYGYYRDQDPGEFGTNNGRERLARILLTREFGRRPKRVNSLETMGLVRTVYPKLEAINRLPDFVGEVPAISLSDWKDFLKIALDFHIRENTFIDLPDAWRKWGGNRLSAKQLMPPETQQAQTNRYKRWPQCAVIERQSRLVRILARGLNIDPQSASGRNAIDAILRGAWKQLLDLKLLEMGDVGRYLKLDGAEIMALAPIENAWLCPVTRRVLDTAFMGITPYLPEQAKSDSVAKCVPLKMPDYSPIANLDEIGDERVELVRDWLNTDDAVTALRKDGLWSDLNDRVVEGAFYFRAAEHSAQQPGARLAEYEAAFKTGRINLLSCSTTMEMGVDIGGISVVAMNNVPPHPANYLQRAGRAGRRSETRSVALSLCKSNPHDQQVFTNPMWPFETVLPAPRVQLSSAILVQRHLNSMLLANFLRKELSGPGSAEKLNLEWWMLPADQSRQQRFCAWTQCFSSGNDPELAKGLRSLLRHTPHEGTASLERLVAAAGRMAQDHARKWLSEFDVVEAELARLSTPAGMTEPAYKALKIQRKRLTGEYLLRELATEGFLPGYGFPTDIAPLDTLTVDELARIEATQRRQQQDEAGRIDNRMRFRELPSRDMVTALREYAPGSEVVIDGLVYRAAGITLNWHTPASVTEANEIQSIRDAWRCRHCGSSGTHVRASRLLECPDCGSLLGADKEVRFDYLEPAGFAVDLYSTPHNDVSTQTFVPVSLPWINANGEWLPLPNPALGVHRSSVDGVVFHHSAGIHGHGFAICLCCGRAEPMEGEDDLPDAFFDHKKGKLKDHRRLRGAQGGETNVCEGSYNAYSIQRGLRLGHEARTDVLELVLRGLDDQPIRDRKIAFTLAVAIRNAIAATLGIESSELGCDTKPVRFLGEGSCQAIVVFDRSASGYASSVADRLPQILRAAAGQLNCAEGCDSACQHCLLDFDTRFRLDDLDRHAGQSFLSGEWLTALELPAELAHFGPGSVAEHQTPVEAITRELAMPSCEWLRIYLSGEPEDWDLAVSPLRRWVSRWAATGVAVELVLDAEVVQRVSRADQSVLAAMDMLDGVTLRAGKAAVIAQGSAVLAEVGQGGRVLAWAGLQGRAVPGANWGDCDGTILVRGAVIKPVALGERLEFALSAPEGLPAQTVRIEISNELDGMADGFGRRMLESFQGHLGISLVLPGERIVELTYHDRYLNAPLPVALLLEFVCALRASADESWDVKQVALSVAPVPDAQPSRMPPSKVWQNWSSDEERDKALVAAFEYAGLDLSLATLTKRDSIHARRLDIVFASGKKLQVWFDQGFSYWQVPRDRTIGTGRVWFPFAGDLERQAESIGRAEFRIEGQPYPTYVFLGWS
ncbi:DEAD/DEAH box helicase [Azoarcus olearius]|uniref:Helicase related protein n=1 Tax=Azoarcus sp. (strain BH72) TaxID=418699 RepID=A1K7X0_AZOSB|nr:DEAD/DEAH box helicase [Azoarcus olearius]CAL94925.1 putative helicase related protein [Azoarcus olearius]